MSFTAMEFLNFEVLSNMAALFGIQFFRECQWWTDNIEISREVGEELVRKCRIQIEKEIAFIEKYHSVSSTTGVEIHPAVLKNILSYEDLYTMAITVGKTTAANMIDTHGIMGGPSIKIEWSHREEVTHGWLRLVK